MDVVVRHQGERRWWKFCSASKPAAVSIWSPGCWFKTRRADPRESGSSRRFRDRGAAVPAYDLMISTHTSARAAAASFLRHEHRLSLCVQLLHRHGLLQSAFQRILERARGEEVTGLVGVTGWMKSRWWIRIFWSMCTARSQSRRVSRFGREVSVDVSGLHRSALPYDAMKKSSCWARAA